MTKTRLKIINLGQQLVLGTIWEHFYFRALCISLAYFNNPSGTKCRLEFAFAAGAQANCQSNIGISHLNILKVRGKKTWVLSMSCLSFKTSRFKISISVQLVAGVSWTAVGMIIWRQKKETFLLLPCSHSALTFSTALTNFQYYFENRTKKLRS